MMEGDLNNTAIKFSVGRVRLLNNAIIELKMSTDHHVNDSR